MNDIDKTSLIATANLIVGTFAAYIAFILQRDTNANDYFAPYALGIMATTFFASSLVKFSKAIISIDADTQEAIPIGKRGLLPLGVIIAHYTLTIIAMYLAVALSMSPEANHIWLIVPGLVFSVISGVSGLAGGALIGFLLFTIFRRYGINLVLSVTLSSILGTAEGAACYVLQIWIGDAFISTWLNL